MGQIEEQKVMNKLIREYVVNGLLWLGKLKQMVYGAKLHLVAKRICGWVDDVISIEFVAMSTSQLSW